MQGPKQRQLSGYVTSANDGSLDDAGRQWTAGESLLRRVSKQLHDRATSIDKDERFSGESAKAASTAFQQSGKKMGDRADEMRDGANAFYAAATAVRHARTTSDEVGKHAGEQPPTKPADLGDAEAQSKYQTQNTKFWNAYADRETAAADAIEALQTNHRTQAEVFQRIHGETPPPQPPKNGGDPTHTTTPPATTHLPTSHPVNTDHNDWDPDDHDTDNDHDTGTDDTGDDDDNDTGTDDTGNDDTGQHDDPGIPQGPTDPHQTTPIPGGPLPGTIPGGVGGGAGAVGGVGAVAGGALGGMAAAGLAAGGLNGGLNGMVPMGGAGGIRGGLSSSGVRGIGSSSRTGVGSVLGRGTGAGGRGAGAGGMAGRNGGRGGRAGSRSGSRGRAGGRGMGAGAGAGRGGKDKKRQGDDRDLFDDGSDWIDDEDAAPGVLD